jgi:NDP-sugar pyrophosphorylase family protein
LGNGSARGVSIQYSIDGDTQLGTGGAIAKAVPMLGGEFGVVYGDSYLPTDYLPVEQRFLASKNAGLMTVYENRNKFDLSNVEFADGKLLNYQKGLQLPQMNYIDYGLMYFRAKVFMSKRNKGKFDLSEICHKLAKDGELDGFEIPSRFYEVGSHQGIQELSSYLEKQFGKVK